MKKVSIVIPVYNSEKHLEKCLDSIFNQTFQDFEVIAVNDGSSDSSGEILDRYLKKYPDQLVCLSQKNGGQSSARNNGLKIATGEFVSFVDSDDYVAPNMLESAVSFITANSLDVVCFGAYEVKGDTVGEYNYCKFSSLPAEIKYLLHEAAPWNKLIKRELLVKNNLKFTEGIIYEDFEMIPQILLHTKKIGYLDERLYYYVVHETSTMRQKSYTPKLKSIFKVVETLKNKFFDTEYRTELEYLFITHLLHDAAFRFLQFEEGKGDVKEIGKIIRSTFPYWRKNKYYKHCSFKYKMFCELVYFNQFSLLRLLFNLKG